MKKTFLNHPHALLTVMVQEEYPNHVIQTIQNGHTDGADAFGIQICRLQPKFRTSENYKRMFDAAKDKPIYVTNYRSIYNEGKCDEDLASTLTELADAGATLCDVMGDYYDKSINELTMCPAAVDKQKRLIETLHQKGAEVLMSSHIPQRFHSAEEILEMAWEHQKRGADVCKIVTGAETEEEQLENLKITIMLKKELKIPFLFLSCGVCDIHRRIGGRLGCCMYLCVQEHNAFSTKLQPVLKHLKAITENFN